MWKVTMATHYGVAVVVVAPFLLIGFFRLQGLTL